MRVGGIADAKTGQVYYALEIPSGESLMIYGNLNSQIRGLDAFPKDTWPDAVAAVHLSFDVMAGCGSFALVVVALFWLLFWRQRQRALGRRWLLAGVILAAPLTLIAVICGWMVTEMGRQPWVISGFLRTRDAVTPAPWVSFSFVGFVIIYLLLAITLIRLLLVLARQPLPLVDSLAETYQIELEERVEVE